MNLIIGKTSDYDQFGKLKNKTISAKYNEHELTDILTEDNWKKLGACEIKCTKCIDYNLKTKEIIENTDRKDEINTLLNDRKLAAIKPKSEIELLKEQNKLLLKRMVALENEKIVEKEPVLKDELKTYYTDKEDNLQLKTVVTDIKKLKEKAKELEIRFNPKIGSDKLLSKIQLKEPEFKL